MEIQQSTPRPVGQNCLQKINIFTLGRFSLVDGKSIDLTNGLTRKLPRKQLDFLKALIAFGGREVDEDLLTETLWEDTEGDYAHRSFASTLYRLRNLLGDKKAIRLRGGRVTLQKDYCWVDVWAFERLLGELEAAYKEVNLITDKCLYLFEQAQRLYQGSFLCKEKAQVWAIPLRERLDRRFERNIYHLGLMLGAANRHEEALALFQKGLEVNALAEEFYRQIMIYNAHLGRRLDAIVTYERYQKVIMTQMGVEPASDIKVLYLALRAGDTIPLKQSFHAD